MCRFKGGSTGSVAVWGRDMGPDIPDRAGPEKILAQGCAMAHQASVEEGGRWDMGLYFAGVGNGGSGIWGDQGIRNEEAEYGRTIYCDVTESGPP